MASRTHPDVEPGPTIRNRGAFALGIAAVLLIIAATFAALLWVDVIELGDGDSAGPERGVTISEIMEDPTEYYGDPVTVSGEVNRVLAPNAFTIGGEDFVPGDELLVIVDRDTQHPQGLNLPEGEWAVENDIVQVSGVVGEFNIEEAEDKAGYVYDNEQFAEFNGWPVVYVDEVIVSPRSGNGP